GDVIATQKIGEELPLQPTDQVASALDSKGNWDVAFTESGKLQYSTAPSGGQFGDTEDIAPVTNPLGLSIAVADDGTPWVSWLDGGQVMAASKSGKAWSVQQVATLADPAQDPQRTSLAVEGSIIWLA